MKYKAFPITRLLILTTIALLAAGCGGSDNNTSDSTSRSGLALRITDAPVNDADIAEVWVRFTQVIVHPADGGDDIVHSVEDDSDPNNVLPYREIELKSLVAGKTSLLGNIPLDAGDYSWVRLVIDSENTRVVETFGGEYLVKCPGCTKSGFKLVQAFNVEATGWVDFIIDFDLRKSLTLRRPNKARTDFDFILRPTLRILDTELASSFIHGMVEDQHLEIDPDVCWVYVYGGDAASTEPDDICLDLDTAICPLANRPLMEAPVQFDNTSGLYTYNTGPIMPGTYTVALVCEADDPEIDDDLVFMQESEVHTGADGIRQDFILPSISESSELSLVKTNIGNADEDGSGTVTEGDTLIYLMHLSNESVITLNNVNVTDPLAGLSALTCDEALPTILAPTEMLYCTATYIVKAEDNSIVNTATATADEVVDPVESSVTVEVGQANN
jgi:uncharacterized repeat protein (TIGR01451 family)